MENIDENIKLINTGSNSDRYVLYNTTDAKERISSKFVVDVEP